MVSSRVFHSDHETEEQAMVSVEGLSCGNVGADCQLTETFSKLHLEIIDMYQVQNLLNQEKYTLPLSNWSLGILFRREKVREEERGFATTSKS